jgi:PAS domain S-box-containing protein
MEAPQQSPAGKLDERVARGTRELAAASDDLNKSELESRLLIDTIPGFVALLTKTGEVNLVNRHLAEYFGATIEEIRQWGTNGMVHPEDLPDAAERFTRSIESGTPYASEHRLRRSDGVYRWFQSRGSPIRDANGQIVGWCWLLTDIDDRNRAENAARASERSLQLIVDTIPAVAWSARTDGSADFFNRHYLEYVGLSAEQVKDWGWMAAVHPDDLNRLAAAWQRSMASGQAGEAEARFRRFDGSYRWFLFRASPLKDESGKIVKWYGTNVDIEDRKRGEEALRARELSWRQIVDNIPGFVATLSPTGEVEFLNRQTLEYFGKTNEELKDWALIDVVHPDDLPRAIEARIKSIETEQIYEIEHRCRRADGVYRWFQVRGLPVRNAEGTITAWYLLLTDIDDRKKAEEALQSNERNLSLITNVIPSHIHVLRPDGSVLYANQAVLDYTGLTLQDVQKEDYRARVFHPDDLERVHEARRDALARAVPFENEQRTLGKDGRYRWFMIRYNPLLDDQGKIDRWYVAGFDIEDRKRAEAQVEQAYLRLAEAQRLSKTGSFITDLVADDHNWSEEAYRIFEFDTNTKVTVQMIRDMVCPEDLPTFDSVIEQGMTGTHVDFVFRIVTARGAVKYIRGMARVMEQIAGRPLFIGALQDVTESKRAEDAIRASERNLKLIIDTIPALAWSARADGSAEFFNQHYLDYVRLSAEQAKDWGWMAAVHPDDLNDLTAVWQGIVASEDPGETEVRLRRHDGEYRWFLFRVSPLRDEQGNIVTWYGINTDIDDRRRVEAELKRAHLHHAEAQRLSKTGSFIADLQADIHVWSEEAFRICEFDPATKLTVQMFRDIVHPEDQPGFDAVIARAMTGTDVDFVFRIVTPRGVVKNVRGIAHVIEPVTRRPLFAGAIQDVTENKVAEEALNRARSELAHVARAATLSTLTASIAHEVNQPLSGIITNASTCLRMLDGDPLNVEGARETARRTLRDGNRASDVIKRLRALFSKKEFTLEPLDLNEATREVIALSLSDLQRNRVILQSELAEDLPTVIGDRVQLQQVILNLLRNASDGMVGVDDRPRQLLIRTEREHGDSVRVTVRDAGVGLDRQSMEKLFDAFYTTKSGGMGIGLSVSRSIIERHHGRLWAEPNDGPGASFTFSIPCTPEASQELIAQ